MSVKWTARLTIQAVCGIAALFFADRLLPSRKTPEDYKVAGVILMATAAALVLADGFFAAAVRKLDEPINLPSFSILERKRLRADLRRMEISLTVSFYLSTVCKGLFGAIGLIFTTQVVPGIVTYAQLFCVGFFLFGFALPSLVLMPRAYFALKAARTELTEMEEEKAARAKVLESLRNDPVHDFANDAHFTSFSRVIDPTE